MKREVVLHALDYVRDDYLESAAQSMSTVVRPMRRRATIAALAACLILCIGILVPTLLHSDAGDLPITEHRTLEETLGGPIRLTHGQKHPIFNEFGGKYIGFFDTEAFFPWYLAVEASVVERLPDIYEEPKTGEHYYILRLHVNDVISGENMPERIFLRIKEEHLASFTEADRLILGLRQVGIERYVMFDPVHEQMETFTLLFEIPESDGHSALVSLTQDGSGVYVIPTDESGKQGLFPPGTSLNAVKTQIRLECEKKLCSAHPPHVYTSSDFRGKQTEDALDYMASDKDGVFVQKIMADGYGGKHITFTRYLNGFETSDTVEIFLSADGELSLEAFCILITEQEADNAPALAPILKALTAKAPAPPHTTVSPERMETTYFSVTGWYTKPTPDGRTYAVIKLLWYLSDGRFLYLDDCYLLVSADGSYTAAQRDELKALIGNDKHIENAEYNTPLIGIRTSDPTVPIQAN